MIMAYNGSSVDLLCESVSCIEIVFCKSGLDRYTLKSVDEVVVMFSAGFGLAGCGEHCNISYYYNLAVWL